MIHKATINALQPTVGSVLAQLILGEKLQENGNIHLEQEKHPQTFLGSLFLNIFQNYYDELEIAEQKDMFIAAITEASQQAEIITFEPKRSPQKVMHEYVVEIHGPKIGPQLLQLKANELNIPHLDQCEPSVIPALMTKLIHATTTIVSDENYLEREREVLVRTYGPEVGLRLSAFNTDIQQRFVDFLAALVKHSTSKIIIGMTLTKENIAHMYMLPLAQQLDACFQIIDKTMGNSVDHEKKKDIKQKFVSFVHEDIVRNPYDELLPEQQITRQGLHSYFEDHHDEIQDAMVNLILEYVEQDRKAIQLEQLLDFTNEHKKRLTDNHKERYGKIIEILGGPAALRDFLTDVGAVEKEPILDRNIKTFFHTHFPNKQESEEILQGLKDEFGIQTFEKANVDAKKRFVRKTMVRHFDGISIQKRSVLEDSLCKMLNLTQGL